MRSKVYWFAVLLVAAVAFIVAKVLPIFNVRAALTRSSFTVRYRVVMENLPANQIVESTRVHAVREDGFIAQQNVVMRANLSEPSVTTTVVDFSVGRAYLVSHQLRRISTRTLRNGERIALQRQQARGGSSDPLCADVQRNSLIFMTCGGREKLLGLDVVRYEVQKPDHRWTSYVAAQLNCFEVKSVHEWLDDRGNIVSRTIIEPLEIRIGEPDSRLFHVPTEYNESPPSEMRLSLLDLVAPGSDVPQWMKERNKKDDLRYWKDRR